MLRRHADGHYLILPEDEKETGTRQAADAGFRRPLSKPALEQSPPASNPPKRCDPYARIAQRPKGVTDEP